MRALKDRMILLLIFSPVFLMVLAGLGVFGSNCQQFTVDVIYDMRSHHHIMHE